MGREGRYDYTQLDAVLRQFEDSLSHPLPDNNNFPPEVEAQFDPSTNEYYNDNKEAT